MTVQPAAQPPGSSRPGPHSTPPPLATIRGYTVLLIPDDEEGGYNAEVPALPGCFTQGDTVEEALANAREAITVHVRGLLRDGEPIPDDRGWVTAQVSIAV